MSEELQNYIDGDWIYDEETYPNCFTLTIERASDDFCRQFEISHRKNDSEALAKCVFYLQDNNQRMVGFNNRGFDYPILHELIIRMNKARRKKQSVIFTPEEIYDLAQKQIESFRGEFGHTIKDKDELIKQVDLFKIHHFDNKAKSTSLKMLEFNMRSKNIEDLPFPVGTILTDDQIDTLLVYNKHDVKETKKFYVHSLPAIRMRADLSAKYGMDFTNHNDTKIGKDYFIMELEKEMPGICYEVDSKGRRHMRQSKRIHISIKDCLFKYYDFKRPEFQAVLKWFSEQRIRETKGVFSDIDESDLGDVAKYAELTEKRKKFKGKPTQQELDQFKIIHPKGWIEEQELKGTETIVQPDGTKLKVQKKSYWMHWREAETLNVVVDGFRFDFGTGGIHGSISDKIARENGKYILKDADVSSMYPNIAIANRVYPEHLSEKFCDIYQAVYELRKSYAKNTPENAVMKLALNGVYGDSNNQFSPFYDPMYTMTITINGQLSLCLLAEKLMEIEDMRLIQVNTDGVTVAVPRDRIDEYNAVCEAWQKQVGLQLEFADYSMMAIRDVNNYIAVYTNGKVKRKGAYQYEGLGWHQNQGGLVIPMAAEAFMLKGTPIEEFIRNHKEKFDFMLRTKVPRSSRLIMAMEDGTEIPQQNICRYYPSKKGGKLIKIMPPLPGKEDAEERRLGIDVQWNVKTCNDVDNFSFDDVDFDYYVSEAEKLLVGVGNTAPIDRDEEGE